MRPFLVRMTIRSLDESLPLKWSNGSAGSTLAMVDVFGCIVSAKLGGYYTMISVHYTALSAEYDVYLTCM